MTPISLLQQIKAKKKKGEKSLAVLIDPDAATPSGLEHLTRLATDAQVDYFFVGGSTVDKLQMDETLNFLREATQIPVIIFPGSTNQLSDKADGLLFLSLISGRNPDLLIGKQVESVSFLRKSTLEIMPTGYMLIDGGSPSSVAYVSNTLPIPRDNTDIALSTALAGQYLGMQLIYLEGGSGARLPVPIGMIEAVSRELDIPLIVGGGIRTSEAAQAAAEAGADIIVIGNILEKDPKLVIDLSITIHRIKRPIY